MADITIHQAAEKAHQLELITLMLPNYPRNFTPSDIGAISSLMAKLSGDVAAFLIEASDQEGEE
ncbi:hypothetical protein AB7188_14755 [Providencia rettgeri]|uniref:hypothetical protein n=1 Tax=Providencia TaxID=586 RepID=UPI000197C3D2|nr:MULTISPECIES: hypothetical protein [Providencia]EFE51441.1 hypothetical protein PROVRETT_09772 [Providencia rettgeri DSM 1131]USR63988.1 hypothetical protein NFC79_14750 [Providencia stuartii]MBG5891035.1 hypothetical protein [Providencia rettgeri]MDH2395327.1 hypothetical protein [Providencia rettgeri]QXA56313.1 hypothetical protein I6L79_12860 [Providencia rettgeri]